MQIRNANIFTDAYTFEKKDVRITGDVISDILPACSEKQDINGSERADDFNICSKAEMEPYETVIDASGLYMIPGLVDIHFHGAMGSDFCDGTQEALQKIAAYEAENGVLAICPATMTIAEDELGRVMKNAREFAEKQGENSEISSEKTAAAGSFSGEITGNEKLSYYATLVGINMEGPFISPKKTGAQNPAHIRKPDVTLFRRLQEASGNLIKLVDIAPEEEGAMPFIDAVSDEVNVSLAHTTAGYDTATEAFRHDARHMTHLFNAMPGLHHREPGPIAAAFENHAEVEIIADGIHLHKAMVNLVFSMFDPDKVILVSDSMEATGLPDGQYQLGGLDVVKRGRKAVLREDESVIAGSVTNLFGCMKHAVREMGIPMETAVRASSVNPAKAIGVDNLYGSIAVGKKACLVLMDEEMNIVKIINQGVLIKE